MQPSRSSGVEDGARQVAAASWRLVPETLQTLLLKGLRIALILCMRRTQGTVPRFTLEAAEDALTLTLPSGWLDEHYLRASELRFEVERQQKMGWPTRLLEA